MINSQFKLRIERAIQEIHDAIRNAYSADPTYVDILKTNQSCYLPIDVGADWNCTIGLMDPLYEEHNQIYDGVKECIFNIILRQRVDLPIAPDLWLDIDTRVEYTAGNLIFPMSPNALCGNMPTHVEYEAMRDATDKILAAIPNLDFSTATVIFKKRNPN